MHPTNQDSIFMPPPPPPSTSPPPLPSSAPPSHPIPELPSGLKLDLKQKAALELSQEKKVALWWDRIKNLVESVLAYDHFQSLEEEYNTAVKATKTEFFHSLPDGDRKRLTAQANDLLSRRNVAEKAYQKTQDRLLQSSSWPITAVQPSAIERENHLDLVKNITELRSAVFEVKNALGEIHGHLKPPPQPRLFLPGSDSDEEEENQFMPNELAMEVDQSSASTSRRISFPSRKRRHLDDFGNDTDHEIPMQPTEDIPTQTELNEFHNKLYEYQEQLASLWNHCNQRDDEQRQDFERELNDRMEKIREQQAKEQQEREKEMKKREAATQVEIKEMDQRLSRDGEDLATITTDMASLLLTVDILQDELQREKQARNKSFQRMLQVEQRLKTYNAAQQENTATLEALTTTFQAYTNRPPSPPMSPRAPALSLLLESLEEPLVDSLRISIRPVIEELRQDVERLVKDKSGQLYSTIWEKISQTLKVLTLIQKRLHDTRLASQLQAQ